MIKYTKLDKEERPRGFKGHPVRRYGIVCSNGMTVWFNTEKERDEVFEECVKTARET